MDNTENKEQLHGRMCAPCAKCHADSFNAMFDPHGLCLGCQLKEDAERIDRGLDIERKNTIAIGERAPKFY